MKLHEESLDLFSEDGTFAVDVHELKFLIDSQNPSLKIAAHNLCHNMHLPSSKIPQLYKPFRISGTH